MQNRDPPTPLKSQPDSKRPKTPNIVTRNLSSDLDSGDPSIRRIKDVKLIPLQTFSGDQIPTNSEVLRRCFFYRDQAPKRAMKAIAEDVFSELEAICLKALAIQKPTKHCKNAVKIIQDLYDDFRKASSKHSSRPLTDKEQNFIKNLDSMVDIVAIDAEAQIVNCKSRSEFKKKIDLDFLKDQRSTRRQFISEKVDTSFQKRAEKHLEDRMNEELHLQELERRFEGEVEEDDKEFQQSRNLREDRRTTSNSKATTPQADAILKDDKVLKAFDRTKMSSRNALMVAAPIMEACGVDISHQTFSRPSLDRWRKAMRNRVASDIKTKFKPPKRSVIHFDGKMLGDNSGNFGDHLAVMISGNTDECRSGKLISAKIIKDSTGESQANEVVSVAEDWNVADTIVGMCFDTTASNTGMFFTCNMNKFDNRIMYNYNYRMA